MTKSEAHIHQSFRRRKIICLVASEIHRSDKTPEELPGAMFYISTGCLVTSNLLKKYRGKILNKSEKCDLVHTLIFHPLKKNG
jgi:hypothetical protein